MEILNLGTKRETFWDSYLVDSSMTTAFPRLLHPQKKETVYWLDQDVDGMSISYPCIVRDSDGYRMYYIAWGHNEIRLCVLLSRDGIHWTRPSLGIYEYQGSTDNNIVMNEDMLTDNMFVFYDTNPACPPDARYKAIGQGKNACPDGIIRRGLWCYYSEDGFRFRKSHLMTVQGAFDSLNTVHWNGTQYVAYIRNFHNIPDGLYPDGIHDINNLIETEKELNKAIRDVRRMVSDDFIHWSEPEILHFADELDYSLYTNVVSMYPGAPQLLIGLPTRYCERQEWTPNFEQLAGAENRIRVMNTDERRSGLAVTDCIFMCSHDGIHWSRYNEAFLTPGYEEIHNWVYGDCYPSYGFTETSESAYSFYTIDYHRSYDVPKPLNRYEIRKDGFACYMSGEKEEVLVTKPLIYAGNRLHLNFETSAYGHIYVDILDIEGQPLSPVSFEVFGNTIDRTVLPADGSDYSLYAGKPVRLRFRMLDAKLYALWFTN